MNDTRQHAANQEKPTTFKTMPINRPLLLLAVILLAGGVYADIPQVSDTDLVPVKKHEQATEIISRIIDSYHYKKKALDDALSAAILDRYLKNLDPNRHYFLAGDIRSFSVYQDKLDDAIGKRNLAPAFEIFRLYRQRVAERTEYAIALLDRDFTFDTDEDYVFDRSESPWAADSEELDEIWRKRVKNDVLNLRMAGKEAAEYRDTLHKRYTRIRTSTYQLDANDVYQAFINAYTTSIEPHTAYLSPRTSENFDISMRLSLEGIGAVLSSDNDYTTIQNIIPGGPADLSKQLFPEDRIIGVGQGENGEIIDVIGWRLDDVVDLIRGPKDTVLRLEILPKGAGPEGATRIITLTRNRIRLEEQAAKSSVIDIPVSDTRIGVIDVPTFYVDFASQSQGDENYKSTSRDVRRLIAELEEEGVDGIVVDLRGNGGGSLSEALELTGLFIKEGPIVQTRDAAGKVEINRDPDPSIAYEGPLAVLVDRNSASASEIFAGAVQDYDRGIVIGEPTFGKGTVQNVVDLNRFIKNPEEDHGRLKTTIAQFFRISGGSNQYKGVIPDIVFPTATNDTKYGERAFDNALPWDKVKPAEYVKTAAPSNILNEVRRRHEARIKTDKAFKLMLQELNLVEQATNRKTVSLLESRRINERDELENTKRELQNAFRIAHGLDPLPAAAETGDPEAEQEDDIDILLNETALIMHDLITFMPKKTDLQAGKTGASQAIHKGL